MKTKLINFNWISNEYNYKIFISTQDVFFERNLEHVLQIAVE